MGLLPYEMTWEEIENLEGITALKELLSKQKKKYVVSIEGNIGCGKSTLVKYFNNFPKVHTIAEPVDKWTNIDGHNALQLLYEDPKRWNFTFNYYAMLTRLEMHKYEAHVPVKMLERSLNSTRYVFIENSVQNGLLTPLETGILQSCYDHLIQSNKIKVDLFVYLRAPPSVCYERLRKRNRKEEAGVPLKFIEELHVLHEDWLIHRKFPVDGEVLVLDASQDMVQMNKIYEECKNQILCGCT